MLWSLLAVPIAALMSMALGMAWYSPLLFGKAWLKLMTSSETDIARRKKQTNMSLTYGLSFIGLFIEAFVVRLFLVYIGVTTIPQALVMAGWIWLGFMAPILLNVVLYGGKNQKLFWLDAGYQLGVVGVMAVTITLFS